MTKYAFVIDQRKCIGCHRSEEHTSELQSQSNLVCRLLLEKKNKEIGQRRRLMLAKGGPPPGRLVLSPARFCHLLRAAPHTASNDGPYLRLQCLPVLTRAC